MVKYRGWSTSRVSVGTLLFLVYINDITTDLETDCFLYADDTSLIDVVDNINSSSAKLNSDLDKIGKWTRDWFVTINPSKTESMIFSTKCNKPQHPDIYFDNKVIKLVPNHQHLGVTLSSNLSWGEHGYDNLWESFKNTEFIEGTKI